MQELVDSAWSAALEGVSPAADDLTTMTFV